jgi:hypothetical protein
VKVGPVHRPAAPPAEKKPGSAGAGIGSGLNYSGHTRIFYTKFTTNLGRTLAGGSTTGDCVTRTAPSGWQIAGFHGRPSGEVDKIGFIYTRR